MAVSIPGRELLANMARILEFIHQGDSVILDGDFAFPVVISDEPGTAEAEPAGALPGFDQGSRAEIRPVKIGLLQHRQNIPVRQGNRHPSWGERWCVH